MDRKAHRTFWLMENFSLIKALCCTAIHVPQAASGEKNKQSAFTLFRPEASSCLAYIVEQCSSQHALEQTAKSEKYKRQKEKGI